MGPRDADCEWRDDPTPRIRSLRLRLSVASLLLQSSPIADQLLARSGILGQGTSSVRGVLAGVARTRADTLRLHASGVNFIDIYFRIGLYKADLPITLGSECAGVVEAVGPEVTEVAVGDRVAYAMARGSYAQYAVVGQAEHAPAAGSRFGSLASKGAVERSR